MCHVKVLLKLGGFWGSLLFFFFFYNIYSYSCYKALKDYFIAAYSPVYGFKTDLHILRK